VGGGSLIPLYLFDKGRDVAELETDVLRGSTDTVIPDKDLPLILGEIGDMFGLGKHFSLIFELGMEMGVAEHEEGAISSGIVGHDIEGEMGLFPLVGS
jgi:hypothetical protein